MTEDKGKIEVDMRLVFPIEIKLSGITIARLHPDGRAEGKIETLQTMLANYKQPGGAPDMKGFLLWTVLHGLLNQRIIGASGSEEIKVD